MKQHKKVLLVVIDGLRPDAIAQCAHPFLREFMEQKCAYTVVGQSVMPTITLPCHLSVFSGVAPNRHGTFSNRYVPPVHKIDGLFEVLARQKRICYSFYTWEELRDLGRPGSLARQELCNYYAYGADADCQMCDRTVLALQDPAQRPDFMFYYSGNTDEVAHKFGWMSGEYLQAVALASRNVERLFAALPEDYCMIITSDHGGHDRLHGTDLPEDMNIPIIIYGSPLEQGNTLGQASLLDLAPTITDLCGVEPSEEWDGRSLLRGAGQAFA